VFRGLFLALMYKQGIYLVDHSNLPPLDVLIDSCITQLKVQGPSRTCNVSKEEEEKKCTWLTVVIFPPSTCVVTRRFDTGCACFGVEGLGFGG